jgi:hypothetical protein
MALEEIGWYRREEFPYILAVEEHGSRETRTLFHQGEELRRWEIGPEEQRVYRHSVLQEKRVYDEQGRLAEEQLFEEGELSRRTVFSYQRDVLDHSETFGPEGELLFRDRYRLSPGGRLRRVSRELVQPQSRQRLALSGGSAGLAEERYGNSRERRVNRYDPAGRLVEQEFWYDGELAERQIYEYRGDSELLSSSELTEVPPERTTRCSYDEEGRIVRIEVEEQGQKCEQTVHVRDELGRVVETTKRGDRGIERWLFEYGGEGELVREEYHVRGSLEKVTLYSSQGEEARRIEELYREGRIFMRIYYEAEEKVKEEFLRDGKVVRVREPE